MYTQDEVLDYVEEEDVKFIRLAFFDLRGVQKNISIMAGQLESAFENGVSFDASAIYGFEPTEKSDLFLFPEPSTISVLPWRPNTGKVVRMFCTIRNPDGTEYKKDCRTMLKNAVRKAREECGVEFNIGTEIEFYLFKLDDKGEPTKIPADNAGYMDIAPEDKGENIRREICFTLEQMGIQPEASHHEEGPGQHEIDFRYSDALSAADNVETFKWIVKTKAAGSGLYADFSPKPINDKAGNGMHINISCRKTGLDANDEDSSVLLPYVVSGILNHIEEITYFLNSSAESYNRIGANKAPEYISWGKENRSALIRIPASKQMPRLELRSPDPLCNPYIALTLIINAAIEGIKNKMEPPLAVEGNLFGKDDALRHSLKKLPGSLEEARQTAAASEFVKSVLGDVV